MALPVYLAMTVQELLSCPALPQHVAYMACHFSPYGTGLTNLPQTLPGGSILIINDRIPVCRHDPKQIARQVQALCKDHVPDGILLDLQRTDEKVKPIIQAVLDNAPCPVAVTEVYAKEFSCPVFLSAPSVYQPLQACIAPWEGRELWLEAAPECCTCTVTQEQSVTVPCCLSNTELPFRDEKLFCHYGCNVAQNQIIFTLQRTKEDLEALFAAAEKLGISRIIGLYQQFNNTF